MLSRWDRFGINICSNHSWVRVASEATGLGRCIWYTELLCLRYKCCMRGTCTWLVVYIITDAGRCAAGDDYGVDKMATCLQWRLGERKCRHARFFLILVRNKNQALFRLIIYRLCPYCLRVVNLKMCKM